MHENASGMKRRWLETLSVPGRRATVLAPRHLGPWAHETSYVYIFVVFKFFKTLLHCWTASGRCKLLLRWTRPILSYQLE